VIPLCRDSALFETYLFIILREDSFLLMYRSHVRFCIYLLGEALSTSIHRAHVGLVIRMSSEVIQEIVPSHERDFRTVLVHTFQNCIVPFCLRIIEFLYNEFLRVWNYLVFTSQLGLGEIKVFA
jgi:hypothetical protein